MDNQRLKKVLIIKPSSLGDVIHALPVASALKSAVPDVDIDWVVNKGYEEILEGNPAISRVITFDRGLFKNGGGLKALMSFVRELRRERYDAVIDLQGLLRSGLMAAACRTGRRVGFANAREGAPWFYTDKAPAPDPAMHAVDRYLLTLKWLNINSDEGVVFTVALSPGDEAQAESVLVEAGLGRDEPFVAIAPSARWETKRWPADNFIRLSNMLLADIGMKSVFVGTEEDAKLMRQAGEELMLKGSLAFGKTSLKGLAALLKRSRLLVTNDSGPMHIASAVGTPAVAVFGPTDPRKTGPYGGIHKVVTAGAPCAPCFRRECDNMTCLTDVTVEQVCATAENMLGGRRTWP